MTIRECIPATERRRPGRRRCLSPSEREDVVRRYAEGYTLREVASAFGVSYMTIRKCIPAAERRGRGSVRL
jgi:transposase-like protein